MELKEEIISFGTVSFKLWLEFEETGPWDDVGNDFANISVDTLDGRKFGINVWTYKYLETAMNESNRDLENLSDSYVIPPDLFVKELTRDCIQRSIANLLSIGNLDEVLNKSVFGLNFIEPYCDATDMESQLKISLLKELELELHQNHVLYKKTVELIAKDERKDEIILELEDKSIAVVHLTWKSSEEIENYPQTRIYKNQIDFWNKEMKQEILDYSE